MHVRDQQHAVMSMLQQVVQRMDQLEERVAAMQVGAKSQPPSAEPREYQRTGQGPSRSGLKERGHVICHRFKKEGHLARGCVAPGPNKDTPPIRETGSPRRNWPDTGGHNRGQTLGTNSSQCTWQHTAGQHHQGQPSPPR